MRPEHGWWDSEMEMETGPPALTRRGVLAGSLKLAGAGALALTLASVAGRDSLIFAQDDSTPEAGGEGEAEVEGGIQVGTTDDTAAVEGDAAAGAELPAAADATADDQTREERRAAREGEEGVGAVGAVPSTGVGAALGSSFGGALGAIGLAVATGAAALFTRRATETSDLAE